MAHRDLRLRELFARFIDGVPLDLVARLLPGRTRVRYGLLTHLHLHASNQRRHSESRRSASAAPRIPKTRLLALIHSLRTTVEKIRLYGGRSEWSHYYRPPTTPPKRWRPRKF